MSGAIALALDIDPRAKSVVTCPRYLGQRAARLLGMP